MNCDVRVAVHVVGILNSLFKGKSVTILTTQLCSAEQVL